MFDLSDDKLTRVKKDTPVDRLPSASEPKSEKADHPLDEPDKVELHSRLLSYYRQEIDRQGENRYQQAIDEDYYWTFTTATRIRNISGKPVARIPWGTT